MPKVAFVLATLNTACRWSKQSVKKKILSIARVVTFEATPKLWGMEAQRNGARKGHAKRKAKPSLSELMSWPDVLSPYIYELLISHRVDVI